MPSVEGWLERASALNWTLFVVIFLAVAVWESAQPLRPLTWPAERRWSRHAILLLISGIVLTVVLRITPVALAEAAVKSRFGILNRAWIPWAVRFALTLAVLDLVTYATHRAFHSVYFLWRVHEVHHSDPDYDVSTAGRFHPVEVVAVQGAHLAAILLLAPPPLAVLAAGLLTSAQNLFTHANASLPNRADAILRTVFITPSLHRLHHSDQVADQIRNLGQTFTFWDRLFGTYAEAGDLKVVTGIRGLQNEGSLGLGFMLAAPFQHRTETQAQMQIDPAPTRPGL